MGHIQILLSNPEKSLSALPKKYLLVDTNFLIDAVRYNKEFKVLREELDKYGFTLVSIDATLIEFSKGSKSIQDHTKKVATYEEIIQTILPIDVTIQENVANISRVLLKKGGQLSYVDCLLLGTTMKYSGSAYLLTKDRSDIPVTIFNAIASIILETPDNNCTFYIYEYNEAAYQEHLTKLISESEVKEEPKSK